MPEKIKSRGLAIILSILYPGLGHLYLGAKLAGISWMLAALFNLWLCYNCYRSPLRFHESGGWNYVILYLGVIVTSAIRAYISTVQHNQHLEMLQHFKKEVQAKGKGYDLIKSRWE